MLRWPSEHSERGPLIGRCHTLDAMVRTMSNENDRMMAWAAQAVNETFNNPAVFLPIDRDGKVCGPAEICHRPPTGTATN